jgi:predicted O-methyltransferase YrrM
MDWDSIYRLVSKSAESLAPELEELQEKYLGNKSENYYRFLYYLVSKLQPDICLEIGVAEGVASAHMCAASVKYGGFVLGIDINMHKIPLQEMFGNYQFHLDYSQRAFTYVRQIVESLNSHIGLVYQDSSSHYHQSVDEFQKYSSLMKPGGIWICNNITSSFHNPNVDPPDKGMVEYFDELPGDKKLFKDTLHYGNTQGIVIIL